MEKEISNGTMLGIALIALAVIIALGFGIFSIAKGTANEGVTKVQTQLTNVQASEFTDYDQTVVTGTQVKSALSNFEGKAVAVLIATKAWQDLDDDDPVGSVDDADELPQVVYGTDKTAINYNALLGGIVGGDTSEDSTWDGQGEVELKDGRYICKNGFSTVGGAIQFYNIIGDMNKSGMTEYINPGTKFTANLIRDESGTNMGILFIQIGS